MEYFVYFFGSAGLLSFLGTIITLLANRGKSAAETRKIKIETEEKLIELQGELQDQIFALIEQGKKDYAEREKERTAKRNELDNLHKRLMQLGEELQNVRSREIQLLSERTNQDNLIRRLEDTIRQINNDVIKIKRVTGQLGK